MARAIEWILRHQDTQRAVGRHPAARCSTRCSRCARSASPTTIRRWSRGIQGDRRLPGRVRGHSSCTSRASRRTGTPRSARKALLDAGLRPGASRARPRRRLAGRRTRSSSRATGASTNPRLEPGGWAFEFANDWYPDVDDSAVILMVLQRSCRSRRRAGGSPRDRRGTQLDARHAEPERRLRRLRHRQRRRVPEPHPVRRHGGDDRSADRGSHRPPARADGDGRLPDWTTAARDARARLPPPHAARRRQLVGALGRQLHLRHLVARWPGSSAIGEDMRRAVRARARSTG